jgi:hypothetical protein
MPHVLLGVRFVAALHDEPTPAWYRAKRFSPAADRNVDGQQQGVLYSMGMELMV